MDLFIHKDAGEEMEEFKDKVFSLFNIELIEERKSSNYPPNDRYFVGYGKLKNIKLWDEDSDTLEDYPFVLSLNDNSYKSSECELPEDIIEIAKKLGEIGIKNFVPNGNSYWEINWDKKGQEFPNK
ncbi:hypothetical protein [Flammeovirga sp. SJP92]|uniref:hypothetical protein n=1 Tax=Flammeovirga sp. SJP92 TaxID=1775430 RepID=UPI000787CB78|nr:hypothetical protein [Flammeovirga sp. SJP92]KXX66730.1 hypothetical protein AVL50_30730 [Flammeovirga sp. SJP92]